MVPDGNAISVDSHWPEATLSVDINWPEATPFHFQWIFIGKD